MTTDQRTAADVVQARLTEQVRELRALDPLVRRDVPDSVHRMRVATRRLRSALATFRPLLDRHVTDPLRDELKWLAGVLGEVRDTEVMHERLTALVADELAGAIRGGADSRIDHELVNRYEAARVEAMKALRSPRYHDLLERLDELTAAPPWTATASEGAEAALPTRVRSDWKRLERRMDTAAGTADRTERAARLHEARKAAKRFRYAAETAVPVHGKDARRLVKRTKRLQTVLGDHHDAVVTQEWLRELADVVAAEGEDTFTFGVIHAREEVLAETSEARLAKTWKKAARKKYRKWLR
jgi:CHAD domain-containing protein